MVDIVRKPGESLEAYHIRSQKDVDTWVAVPPDARACFTDHMLKVIRRLLLLHTCIFIK